MEKTVKIKVVGKVQGVGFRWCAFEQFVDLGLKGKAENTPDGGIEILVTGETEKLKDFLRWAQKGPQGAKVSKMDYEVIENSESILDGVTKKPEEED